jgi:TRAP-type mannitol/chloroaromatic compound transport system permease large subunit
VEAAATGAVLLLVYGIWGGHLNLTIMRDCLQEAAATTGALFALLVAATSFTLILRLLGTDRLMASWLLGLDMAPLLFLCLILVLVTLAALVLDAFEIIFVIIPLFAPPLLMRVDDAVWVSVCLLLTLQLAFLLPPIGYAVMMTRGLTKPHVPLRQVMRAIKPYLALQALCLVLVLVWPASVHLFDSPQSRTRQGQGMVSPTPIETQLKQLLPVQEMPALPHR